MLEDHNTFKIDFYERKYFDFRGVELTTCLIIDEAIRRGIKAQFVLGKYLELKFNGRKALFNLADNTSLSYLAERISASKSETKEFLKREGIAVPEGRKFDVKEIGGILEYAERLQEPLVVKPDNGSEGKGVYCGVKQEDIISVTKEIARNFKSLVVERQISGNEYRLLATIDNYIAVIMRRPASVLGDSQKSLQELIEEKNVGRQSKSAKPLTCPFIKIEVDDVVQKYLIRKGLSLGYIPLENERVYLRENSNISTGGDAIELTDKIHPSVREIAFKALKAIPGMTYAGIDLITSDITQDIKQNGYAILELNNKPGIWPLHYPYIGKPQNVAGALINLVFPETKE
ncbi:MAG: ATP-grasp domain-containing protein [Nanoarchaeota archaeon]|mgnify:CR=1 FL=1